MKPQIFATKPSDSIAVTFSMIYNQIQKEIPVTVNDLHGFWPDYQELIHDPFKRYGMKMGAAARSADNMKRRMVILASREGNIILYEPLVDRQDVIAVMAPKKVLETKFFKRTNEIAKRELEELGNINLTSTIYLTQMKRLVEKRA